MIGLRSTHYGPLMYTKRPWTKKLPVMVRKERGNTFIYSNTEEELGRIIEVLEERNLTAERSTFSYPTLARPISIMGDIFEFCGYVRVGEEVSDLELLKSADNFLILDMTGKFIQKW